MEVTLKAAVDLLKNVGKMLVDGVFGNFTAIAVLCGIFLQVADSQIGMDVFGIEGGKQDLHIV